MEALDTEPSDETIRSAISAVGLKYSYVPLKQSLHPMSFATASRVVKFASSERLYLPYALQCRVMLYLLKNEPQLSMRYDELVIQLPAYVVPWLYYHEPEKIVTEMQCRDAIVKMSEYDVLHMAAQLILWHTRSDSKLGLVLESMLEHPYFMDQVFGHTIAMNDGSYSSDQLSKDLQAVEADLLAKRGPVVRTPNPGPLNYVIIIDKSMHSHAGVFGNSHDPGATQTTDWLAGENVMRLMQLDGHLLSIPYAKVFVCPWGQRDGFAFTRVTSVSDLMSSTCISVDDVVAARQLHRFVSQGVEDAYKQYEVIKSTVVRNVYQQFDPVATVARQTEMSFELLKLMPPNSILSYDKSEWPGQLIQIFNDLIKRPGNFACVIHTSHDIYLSNSQWSIFQRLKDSRNVKAVFIQFAAHLARDYSHRLSTSMAEVDCTHMPPFAAKSLRGMSNDDYSRHVATMINIGGYSNTTRHLQVCMPHRDQLWIARSQPQTICGHLLDLKPGSRMLDAVHLIVSYLITVIHNVATQPVPFMQVLLEGGDASLLYSAVIKLDNAISQLPLDTLSAHARLLLQSCAQLRQAVQKASTRLNGNSRRTFNLRLLTLGYLQLNGRLEKCRTEFKVFVDLNAQNLRKLGAIGIGFQTQTPSQSAANRAFTMDKRDLGPIVKHFRAFPPDDEYVAPVYIATDKIDQKQGEYANFIYRQLQLIISMLVGEYLPSRTMLFVAATQLITNFQAGDGETQLDSLFQLVLVDFITHFDVQSVLPEWHFDETTLSWTFDQQQSAHMNPNFWRAIVLASRYQTDLRCAELKKFRNATSTYKQDVDLVTSSDGSVIVVDKVTREPLPPRLSMEVNRIRCQLDMYRGLVRLKAAQSLAFKPFVSTAMFEVESMQDDDYLTDINLDLIATLEQLLVPTVNTADSALNIWLPYEMYIDGQFQSGNLAAKPEVLSLLYSDFNQRMMALYHGNRDSALETRAEYVARFKNLLVRHVYPLTTQGIETAYVKHEFQLLFKDIIVAFGTSHFGLHEKLVMRIADPSRSHKLSREDVKELSEFATQLPVPQYGTQRDFCMHAFNVAVPTLDNKTHEITLSSQQYEQIMKMFADKVASYLNPQVVISSRPSLSTCSCCLETMAAYFNDDRREIAMNCGHEICAGCLVQVVITAQQVPYQLVTCPLCRIVVSLDVLSNACHKNGAQQLQVYQQRVLTDIPTQHLSQPAGNVKAIKAAMERSYFGVCSQCADKVCVIAKECAGDSPIAANFICGSCVEVRAQLLGQYEVSCPHCLTMISRISGCQFMTCACGGNFCYLCGHALTRAHHNSHYGGYSFISACLRDDRTTRLVNCQCQYCAARQAKK